MNRASLENMSGWLIAAWAVKEPVLTRIPNSDKVVEKRTLSAAGTCTASFSKVKSGTSAAREKKNKKRLTTLKTMASVTVTVRSSKKNKRNKRLFGKQLFHLFVLFVIFV